MAIREEEVQQEVQEGFKIEDDHKANWVFKKLKELQKDKKKNEEFAKEEINQIKMWLDDGNGKLDESISWFENALQHYFYQLRKDNPKLKTHSLPFGKLQTRSKTTWHYEEDRLLKYLKENNIDAVRVKESVDKSGLKKMVEIRGDIVVYSESGEILEGITIEGGETFSVKVAK